MNSPDESPRPSHTQPSHPQHDRLDRWDHAQEATDLDLLEDDGASEDDRAFDAALSGLLKAQLAVHQPPLARIDLSAANQRGQVLRRRQVSQRRTWVATGVAAAAAAVAAVVLTAVTLDREGALLPQGSAPAASSSPSASTTPSSSAEAAAQMAAQQQQLDTALAAALARAGVELAGPVNLIPDGNWNTHLWQALLSVRTPDGARVPVRVGLRAPGPMPDPVDSRGVSDVTFADVDCGSPATYSWPSASPSRSASTQELVECSVQTLRGGSTLTLTAAASTEPGATGEASGRQTVLRTPEGALVWVFNGNTSDPSVEGLDAAQQREVVTDTSLLLSK